jgi:hypothetical protein
MSFGGRTFLACIHSLVFGAASVPEPEPQHQRRACWLSMFSCLWLDVFPNIEKSTQLVALAGPKNDRCRFPRKYPLWVSTTYQGTKDWQIKIDSTSRPPFYVLFAFAVNRTIPYMATSEATSVFLGYYSLLLEYCAFPNEPLT